MKKKYIYDQKMAEFFILNGGKLLDIEHHKKTGAKYWVFVKDEILEELYGKWNKKCEELNKKNNSSMPISKLERAKAKY